MIDRLSIIGKLNDKQRVKDYLSITSMDPICLGMMFRSGYPRESSYGVIKIPRKQDIRKKIFFLHSPSLFYFQYVRNVGLRRSYLQKTTTFVAISFRAPNSWTGLLDHFS